MPLMVSQVKVRDYAGFRQVYEDHEPSWTASGITNGRVYQKAEDPNDMVILCDVADVAKAHAWAVGDDLKAAIQKGGVTGTPTFDFVG